MNINVKVGKYLVPDIQKIIWKKIFQECMKDLEEKTLLLNNNLEHWNYPIIPPGYRLKSVRLSNGCWRFWITLNQ